MSMADDDLVHARLKTLKRTHPIQAVGIDYYGLLRGRDTGRDRYENRVQDLRRIASGGTGILRPGAISEDLVNRLAGEAAKAARHLLRMCIRALDYVPPVDIPFGEYGSGLGTQFAQVGDHLAERL